MFEKEDDEIIRTLRNMRNRLPYFYKYTKRTENNIKEQIYKKQKGIGASMNFNRDYQNENYKYNKLRTKLIAQRKRQEDRENSERI